MRNVGILVSSDKCSTGKRVDTSGKAIFDIVKKYGYEPLPIVIVPDEKEDLLGAMQKFVEIDKVNLLLTTGGTGFSVRDIVPEVTKMIIEKETPGIAEAMRMKSLQITDRAMLSRGVAGITGQTLIVNLPGSEKAVRESLGFIIEPLEHGLDILSGTASDCARK